MCPLETLFSYYSTRTTEVKEYMAYYLLTRLANRRDGWEEPQMKKWLTAGDPAADIRKALSVSALIDFIFLTKGNEIHWQQTFDQYLHLVDSGDTSVAMRTRLQVTLLHFDERKADWLKAFEDWKDLRQACLSEEQLLEWESKYLYTSPNVARE